MKTEIISALENLLAAENALEIQREFKTLAGKYKAIGKNISEEESKVAESTESAPEQSDIQSNDESNLQQEHENAESGNPIDGADSSNPGIAVTDENDAADSELDEKYNALTAQIRAKIDEAKARQKKLETDTIQKAKDLLQEFEKLVAEEENIGKAFSGFNALREHWKALPKLSNDDYRDLNLEYNKLSERFFYNINIYKELKDLDLKHNLDEKNKVLEDHKKLLDIDDIRLLEVEVRMNQDRWNEIGPTFKEDWEKLKDEFWAVTRSVYGKIQKFYDDRREEYDNNYAAKLAILEEAKSITQLELKSPKKWQEKTNKIIELQEQWKTIGFVPKEKSASIWKEFRKTCDSFFESKRTHFAEIHKVHEANKLAKEKLVEQAEHLQSSEDWSQTSGVLVKLQNDWKKIGPAHQRDDNALWKRFRQACDTFFAARNAQKSGEIAGQAENLLKKQALIEKIASYVPGADTATAIEQLKHFGEEWRAIGHVPFKDKEAINDSYKKSMDAHFETLKIEKKARQKIQFEEKLENLKDSQNSQRLIQKEEESIRHKIAKIQAEIKQYENNIGFFANSKGADKFKNEIIKKISIAKEEVDKLKSQLQIIRNA